MAEEKETPNIEERLPFLKTWKGCVNCGNKDDLGAYFFPGGTCKNCVKKAHRKAMGK
jgi:hypothetical protein